jgi:hypothetical protein
MMKKDVVVLFFLGVFVCALIAVAFKLGMLLGMSACDAVVR